MRSSDEIKKGLECCADSGGTCEECPYADGECRAFEQLASDALALIQKLQEEVSKYEEGYDALTKIIKRLEAERDAAADALTKIVQNHDESFCEYCDNWDRYLCPPFCRTYCERFKWRGVQKEDGNGKA